MDALTAMKQAIYVIENELSDYRLDNPHVADEAIQSIEDLRQAIKYIEDRTPVAWTTKSKVKAYFITNEQKQLGYGDFTVPLYSTPHSTQLENEKDSLELELWKDGALLHESHYEYQNKLKDMITELLFSGKNVIHKDCEFNALALLKHNLVHKS